MLLSNITDREFRYMALKTTLELGCRHRGCILFYSTLLYSIWEEIKSVTRTISDSSGVMKTVDICHASLTIVQPNHAHKWVPGRGIAQQIPWILWANVESTKLNFDSIPKLIKDNKFFHERLTLTFETLSIDYQTINHMTNIKKAVFHISRLKKDIKHGNAVVRY